MKTIDKKEFDEEIDSLIDYSFDVASDGLYTIRITASATHYTPLPMIHDIITAIIKPFIERSID